MNDIATCVMPCNFVYSEYTATLRIIHLQNVINTKCCYCIQLVTLACDYPTVNWLIDSFLTAISYGLQSSFINLI